LLQYRLSHDAEISEEYYDEFLKGNLSELERVSPSEKLGNPQRFTFDGKSQTTNGVTTQLAGFVRSNGELGSNWYGLKMWYKTDVIGNVNASGDPIIGPDSRLLSKDAALQFKVPSNAATAILKWEPINPNTDFRDSGISYFVEAIVTRDQQLRRDLQSVGSGVRSGQNAMPIPLNTGFQATELRIKPWDMESMKYSIVFHDGAGNEVNVDGQRTYIEATGYSGKAKRLLRIGVSRNAGNILESQDFLLYSGDRAIILQ
jgi:hypothetical protein